MLGQTTPRWRICGSTRSGATQRSSVVSQAFKRNSNKRPGWADVPTYSNPAPNYPLPPIDGVPPAPQQQQPPPNGNAGQQQQQPMQRPAQQQQGQQRRGGQQQQPMQGPGPRQGAPAASPPMQTPMQSPAQPGTGYMNPGAGQPGFNTQQQGFVQPATPAAPQAPAAPVDPYQGSTPQQQGQNPPPAYGTQPGLQQNPAQGFQQQQAGGYGGQYVADNNGYGQPQQQPQQQGMGYQQAPAQAYDNYGQQGGAGYQQNAGYQQVPGYQQGPGYQQSGGWTNAPPPAQQKGWNDGGYINDNSYLSDQGGYMDQRVNPGDAGGYMNTNQRGGWGQQGGYRNNRQQQQQQGQQAFYTDPVTDQGGYMNDGWAAQPRNRSFSGFVDTPNTWNEDYLLSQLDRRMPATNYLDGWVEEVVEEEDLTPKYVNGKRVLVNSEIEASKVRVQDASKAELGVMSYDDARDLAIRQDADVILINEGGDPPVVRLLAFSKYKYELEKSAKQKQKASKGPEIKEVKLRPVTEKADYDTKIRSAQKFLSKGAKVKLTMTFSGREMRFKDQGKEMMLKLIEELSTVSKMEAPLALRPSNFSVTLVPLK